MRKAVIITSHIDNPLKIQPLIQDDDYIICADGGYSIASSQGILPDVVIGDFDSINEPVPPTVITKKYPPEKDYTDLELALMYALDIGISSALIIGAIGGRLDHTIASIQLLSKYSSRFKKLKLQDGMNTCFVLHGSFNASPVYISGDEKKYLSLFSISDICSGVTVSGVKYPLYNDTLTNTVPLGVSNEFKKREAAVSLTSGILLVIISRK